MKYFGQVVNKTDKRIAVFLSGHPKVKSSVVLQPNEESEVYHIDDEELVVRLLEHEIAIAKLIKIPTESSSLLLLIEFK